MARQILALVKTNRRDETFGRRGKFIPTPQRGGKGIRQRKCTINKGVSQKDSWFEHKMICSRRKSNASRKRRVGKTAPRSTRKGEAFDPMDPSRIVGK